MAAAMTPETTTQTTVDPTLKPFVTEENRCMHNIWNQSPGPSAGSICPTYGCYSCCNEQKALEHYNNGFSVDKITHYGPYRFDGCTKTGHGDPNNKAGHLSEKCHEFVGNNHCVTACSPNVYPWFASTGETRLDDHLYGMKVCPGFCSDFYNACKDDYICFNKDGLLEYMTDLISLNLSEEKDYKIYSCEGNYECQKISDSFISKEIGDVFGKVTRSGNTYEEPTKAVERFCERFSFDMYQQENLEGAPCIDPRDENSIIAAVKRHEEHYNANNENYGKQRSFPTTDSCPTGLATGAIYGIVFGSLFVAFAAIGAVFYFSRKSNQDEKPVDYEPGNTMNEVQE